MMARYSRMAVTALAGMLFASGAAVAKAPALPEYRARPAQRDVIYFVLPDRFENGDKANDRGGLVGDRLVTGFDPTARGFYHGGDLKGLIQRLDYIKGLGATALWVGPIFKNKPVQGAKGEESAGYHGYWITDFTTVDPHFGTEADFKTLVDAAHARGMKVYMDIICNHTADVIQYREGVAQGFPYRSKADYPFTRRGGAGGVPINAGFAGDDDPSAANWAKMTDPSFAYTPYVPKGEEHAKKPDWLNDPKWYHNRGNTDWQGESAQYGDFSGLDDLATENPRVVRGMIDIYGSWIDRFGVDGFRIDTAKHVNPEFWRAFVPAMQTRARARGIPRFHIFGEVATSDFDPALLASWTRNAGLPAVLDFAFGRATVDAATGRAGTDELVRLFDDDVLYQGGAQAALRLPTFIGNHDAGRIAMFLRQALPQAGEAEILARDRLAHALLLTLRGIPVIYYGDEQGFGGLGGDQSARQDMFPSQVVEYNSAPLVGTTATTATASFNPGHPLYRLIADLTRVRLSHPALTDGATKVRHFDSKPGLLAISRFDPVSGREMLLLFNTSTNAVSRRVEVGPRSRSFEALLGKCPVRADAPGSVLIDLAPLEFAVCGAKE